MSMATRYWLFLSGVLLLTGFISYGTYTTAQILRRWRPPQNILLHPGENLIRLGLIGLCLGLGVLSGLSWARLGWLIPRAWQQIIWGISIGLLVGIFFYYSTRWITARTGQRVYSTTVIEHITPANKRELVLVLLAMVPIVFLEELLFRSLLLGGLSPILPVGPLLFGLGILFGLLHSPQGLWGMVGAGLAGLIFGLLFIWQGSLLTPLIAHYITNTIQIIQAGRKQTGRP